MEYLLVGLVSLGAAALTLFSGFGLGTLLLPAFALFFPVDVAIAATAVVHLMNNLFKLLLVGRNAHWGITLKFTLPALIGSTLGAMLLVKLGKLPPLATYLLLGKAFQIETVKMTIGLLITGFSIFDLHPRLSKLGVSSRFIPAGGALSGFFGGLCGMQGALRSLFLIRAGLDKEQFIGTTVVAAVIVDLSRLAVYGSSFVSTHFQTIQSAGTTGPVPINLVVTATFAALTGSFVGAKLVKKVTLTTVQKIVGFMLVGVGLGMCCGIF